MNILQIAPDYPPYLGGQERFILNLSRILVRMGHRVTVLTSRYPSGLPFHSEEDGVQVFRYTSLMRPFRNPIFPGLLFSPKSVAQADVIHVHNEHSFAANAAAMLKWRFGKPMILTVHGRLIMGSRTADFFVKAYEQTVSRIMFQVCDGITTAWFSDKIRLCERYHIPEARVSVIPYGIDLEYWKSFQEKTHSPYSWEPSLQTKKAILVATQLTKRKGIDYLIRAMPFILSTESDAVLLIAGSGDEEANLRRLARSLNLEDQVRFLGRVFDAELSAAHRAADVFVLPSLSEGLPVCVMEAWAHGKPVVATRIDGAKDSFAEVADLVEPADSGALADAVIRVLRDPEGAAAKGKAGRKLMEKEYAWPVVAKQMVSAYETVLEQKRRRAR